MCVLCPRTGSLQSLKTPGGLGLQLPVAGLLGPSVLCTLVSGGLGAGVASTVLCLQLVQKVKVSDASIQEVLEPLNLDFSSPLEKVGATVTPRPAPPQRPTQPRKYWKGSHLGCSRTRPQGRRGGQASGTWTSGHWHPCACSHCAACPGLGLPCLPLAGPAPLQRGDAGPFTSCCPVPHGLLEDSECSLHPT